MTDGKPRFVGTNVLIYANQIGSAHHDPAVRLLRQADADGLELWISAQVLREYLAAVTRVQGHIAPLTMPVAVEQARLLAQRFWILEDGPSVRAQLLTLLSVHPVAGRQVHDANIVATMLAHGVTHLLTFNVADFTRFADIVTIETGPHA